MDLVNGVNIFFFNVEKRKYRVNVDYYTTGTGDQTNDAPQSSYNNHVIKKCFFCVCVFVS